MSVAGTVSMMDEALRLARSGLPVFPVNSRTKAPMTPHGFHDASTDEGVVRDWWARSPSAMIGVPTGERSGIAVLDLDIKRDPKSGDILCDGEASLRTFMDRNGWTLPDTVEAKTPRGGRHVYFAHEPGFGSNANDRLGIDCRGAGGYIVYPPSVKDDGARYIWKNPPGLFELAPAPAWLGHFFRTNTLPGLIESKLRREAGGDWQDFTAATSRPEDIERALYSAWDPDSFDDWTTAALALHGIPEGREMWLGWAATSPKFDRADNERKWTQTHPSRGITPRTILSRVPRSTLADWAREHRGDTLDDLLARAAKTQSKERQAGDQKTKNEPPAIKTLNLIELLDETEPDEPDFLEPDFLGPGNFCLIAGPPKAQKSFLLTDLLIACATGGEFLDGTFKAPRPLKVFYLQAEMNRKLLRKRARMMGFLEPEKRRMIGENLVVTDRFQMLLDANGVRAAVAAIKAAFPDGPDIIAIDPLANVYDGENEDRAGEIMGFLTGRIEALRRAVNPKAAVVMVHHSAKKTHEDMARDPFVAIRGSGALRGYYDTGVIIFRKSEEGSERRVHFELRSGESPEPMTVRLTEQGTFERVDTTMEGIPRATAVAMLKEIESRWQAGKPLSTASQTRTEGRYAPLVLAQKFDAPAKTINVLIEHWLMNGIVEMATFNTNTKQRGLKVLQWLD